MADRRDVEVALAAFALAPGLALGSFLNVVAARVPRKRSIIRPASACMHCSTPIAWYDNVPLVSYAVRRGRCRTCGAQIGLLYPAVELTAAVLVAGCVLAFGLTPEGAVAAFFCSVLVAISAVDLEHRIVPDRIVLPATVVVLAAQMAIEPSLEWPLAALGASLFLFLAVLAYPAGMGMGDVKLALLMGAALGKSVTVALMLGMFAALVPGIYLLARHGSAGRKMTIPFAPFLALGSVVALFFGDQLFDGYLGLLGD
ncbi:MAG TPA: prepilin peptidase [Gaiellaceae bacterium]|nr:prepilin peptidase [Gaiellaceae bacterium]